MTVPETWYVHQDDANDEAGGWCVLTVDRPPRALTGEDVDAGRRLVADFASEADARRIVDLHNADLAGRLLPDGGETRTEWEVRWGDDLDLSHTVDGAEHAAVFVERMRAVGLRAQSRQRTVGPWVAVDQPEEKP